MDQAGTNVDVDKLQLKLLSKRKFQILAFICLGVIYARGAWNVFGILFLARDVTYICDSSGVNGMTVSYTQHVDISSTNYDELKDNNGTQAVFRECDVVIADKNSTNISRPCTSGWVYRNKLESTIVSEWDLVCVRAYLAELSTTIYMVGSMFGALLITPLADKIGRRLILLFCLPAQAAVGVGVALSLSYTVFTALRFIIGFFNMGIALITYVMMTEIFPAQHRTVPCCGFQIFWAFGIMLTSLFGFLVQDWRHLQLLITLPNLVCAAFMWFLPESLPWLVSQSKMSEAQSVVIRIAQFNNIDPPPDLYTSEVQPVNKDSEEGCRNFNEVTYHYGEQPLLSGLLSHQDAVLLLTESSSPHESQQVDAGGRSERTNVELNRHNCDLQVPASQVDVATCGRDVHITMNDLKNVLILCQSSRIWLYIIIMSYLFFVNSLSYYGISLSTPVLHGNQYLNLFLMGAVEVPAYIINVFVCNRFGRRIPLFVFMLMCGAMNIAALFVPEDTTAGMYGLRVTLVMLGKFAVTGSYTTVYLYSAEIFPTSVRNRAIGISSFFENLGFIAAPSIVYSAKSFHELPLILFGVVSIIGGALVGVLPETHNCPLPQTLEEAESWNTSKHEGT